MFETLDEQIKQTEAEAVPTKTVVLRYLGVGVVTLVIFGALYMAMMFLEY